MPDIGHNSEARLSLADFNEEMQGYITSISESRSSLRLASMLFSIEDRTILPVQCRKALQSLEEVDEPVQEFSKLLREPERLPVIITALRFRPLSILNLMDNQINKLFDLTSSYLTMCISPSKHEKQLRKEIHRSFESLLHYNTIILDQVKRIGDEAEDQERRLLSLSEEE